MLDKSKNVCEKMNLVGLRQTLLLDFMSAIKCVLLSNYVLFIIYDNNNIVVDASCEFKTMTCFNN